MNSFWKKYKIAGIAKIIGGGTPKTTIPEYWNGSIPWISIVDFQGDKKYITNTEKTITDEGLKRSSTNILPKGAVIISARGTVGELGVLKHPMAFNQSCYGVLANNNTTNEYLYYLLKHTINQFKSHSYGSVFSTITRKTFEEITVTLPPLPTQHRIAEILGALDDKIELNLQMNKTLEDMAMTLYKHWFVDFGPFKDGEFEESELGLIPEGWEVKTIKDVLSISKKTIKPYEYPTEKFCHFSIPAFDESLFPKLEHGGEIASNKTLIVKNTILVSKLNPRIKRIWTIYKPKDITSFSSTEFINYVPKSSSDWAYFNCFLRNDEFYNEFLNHATGTTGSRQRVSPRTTLDFKLIYPSNDSLIRFHNIVGDYFSHIQSNILEIDNLKQTRDYLLPKLISGEIEVKTAESKIKEVL